MMRYLGVDHGGTRTKLLLIEATGDALRVVRRESVSTETEAGSVDALAATATRFLDGTAIDGFGITVAGIVDTGTGVVRASMNMPWLAGTRPAADLAARLGAPGLAVHDGAAAATAEAVLGAGRGHDDVFVLALGTGIAGAHVLDGTVRRGAHGAAGEVGHVPLGGDRACSCGQRGCLESEIGGARLAARWADSGRAAPGATAKDLVAAAAAGDEAAAGILDDATSALARSLLGIVAVLDPGVIVVGGGLSAAADEIVDPAVAKAKAWATFHRLPRIVPAALGVWAGAWGAALAARAPREAADAA